MSVRALLGAGLAIGLALPLIGQAPAVPEPTVFDLVILGGRVMDPATGLDVVRAVGITSGKIRAITTETLRGRETIDAQGYVVAPGFIDLHQHAQDAAGYRVEALDGTTTALELEGGTADVDRWYADRAGRALIHHGVSVSGPPPGNASPRSRSAGTASRVASSSTSATRSRSSPRPWPTRSP